MKKVLGIMLALALTIAIAVPVVASDVVPLNPGTGVTVNQGDSDPPIIKAKWEQLDPSVPPYLLEDGDPDHLTPLTQLLPPLVFNTTINVQYWAIVTDPNDVSTVTDVWVTVYHPEGPPECASKKYKKDLDEVDKGILYDGDVIIGFTEYLGIDSFLDAWEAGLVTWNANLFANETEAYDDIMEELIQCHAKVYMGVGVLDYHQPWGDYRVEADAADSSNTHASDGGYDLTNFLTYLPVAGIELDFTHVDYGAVEICSASWVAGDTIFSCGDSKPTVRNIGNTEVELAIQQDDMGFDYEGVPPDINWNVEFDVRLGAPSPLNPDILFAPAGRKDIDTLPDPGKWTTITPTLGLCNTQKINFSIHVIEGAGDYSGNMWILYQKTDFSGSCGG